MTVFLVTSAILIFIIYMFQSDKKHLLQKNLAHGGLKAKYPNFVWYCFDKEFIKDTGRYLEYRKVVDYDTRIKVYFHYGLQDAFGTYAYCYAVSTNGYQTKKYMPKIKKPMIGFEIDIDAYEVVFESLLVSALKGGEFIKLNVGNGLTHEGPKLASNK